MIISGIRQFSTLLYGKCIFLKMQKSMSNIFDFFFEAYILILTLEKKKVFEQIFNNNYFFENTNSNFKFLSFLYY